MGFAREYGPRLHLGIGDHDVLPPPVPGFISRARFGRWNLVKLYRLGIGIIDDGRRRLRAGQQRSRIRVVISHGAKPRSAERRFGKEGVRRCKSRGVADDEKKKKTTE